RHFAREPIELVDHGVQRFFELQDFAAHVDGDLAGEIATGDGRGHLSDVADLAGQVAGHEVHVVGEVFPGAADAGHLRLSAQFAFGADFAGHPCDFRGEGTQLIHHRVDGFFQLENFTAHVHGNLVGEIAAGHCGGDLGNVAHLSGQVASHGVYRIGEILPGARHAGTLRLPAEPSVCPDFA